jgi:hypothetical protein
VSWLRAGQLGFDPWQGQRIFLLAPASRLALGPTQPPIQWVLGVLSPGVKCGWGVTLTTHAHLVPRLSMSRSYTSSPPCASVACSGTAFFRAIIILFSHISVIFSRKYTGLCQGSVVQMFQVSLYNNKVLVVVIRFGSIVYRVCYVAVFCSVAASLDKHETKES